MKKYASKNSHVNDIFVIRNVVPWIVILVIEHVAKLCHAQNTSVCYHANIRVLVMTVLKERHLMNYIVIAEKLSCILQSLVTLALQSVIFLAKELVNAGT